VSGYESEDASYYDGDTVFVSLVPRSGDTQDRGRDSRDRVSIVGGDMLRCVYSAHGIDGFSSRAADVPRPHLHPPRLLSSHSPFSFFL